MTIISNSLEEHLFTVDEIIEIINIDPTLFKEFVIVTKGSLSNFDLCFFNLKNSKNSKNNKDLINDLFEITNSIIDKASMLDFKPFIAQAQKINHILTLAIQSSMINDIETDEISLNADKLNLLFDEINSIFEKNSEAKFIDYGRIRNEKRSIEERDNIKVKTSDFDKLNELIKSAKSLVLDEAALKYNNKEFFDNIMSIFSETEKQMSEMSKIPLSKLLNRFPRMVSDISNYLGKKTKYVVEGDDVLVDKKIFTIIGDPIIHIIKNSLEHGIELPHLRTLHGKDEEGTVNINIKQLPQELIIELSDDGKGINIENIKITALKYGYLHSSDSKTISDDEVLQILFIPGFSINEKTSRVSGIGIGLDSAKRAIEKTLGGVLELKSEKYKGVKITLKIPT